MPPEKSLDPELKTLCRMVRYKGRVQGVGFRYTVQHLAQGFTVAGYVRNLPSGDVELVAQGSADQVSEFLAAVAGRMRGYIQDTIESDQPPGDHQNFEIRF
jgi:acylphosphatase